MELRGRRYSGVVEIATQEEEIHDVLDAWQSLYTPPKGARPRDHTMERWERLPEKPNWVPQHPIRENRDILIWQSIEIPDGPP